MKIRSEELADKDTLADGRIVADVFRVYHPWSENNPEPNQVARIHVVCTDGSFLSMPPDRMVEIARMVKLL